MDVRVKRYFAPDLISERTTDKKNKEKTDGTNHHSRSHPDADEPEHRG